MDEEFKEAVRIHGYTFSSDSDSDSSDNDEDLFELLRPPPIPISDLKERAVRVPAIKKPNYWEKNKKEPCDKNSKNVSRVGQNKAVIINDHNNPRQSIHLRSPWKEICSESTISTNILFDLPKEFPPLPSKKVRNTNNKENENSCTISSVNKIIVKEPKNVNPQALKQHIKHSDNNVPKYFSATRNNIVPTSKVFQVSVDNTQLIKNKNKKPTETDHAKRKTDNERLISNNLINNTLEESDNKPKSFSKKIHKHSNISKTNLNQNVKFDYQQDVAESTIESSENENVTHSENQILYRQQTPKNKSNKISNSTNSKSKKSNYKIKDTTAVTDRSRKVSKEKNDNKRCNQQKSRNQEIIKHNNNSPRASETSEKSGCESPFNKSKLSITENRVSSRNNAVHNLIKRAQGLRSKRIVAAKGAKARRKYDITNFLIMLGFIFIILIFYGIFKIISI